MDKIRIGKDITVTGSITVNGIAVCLEGLHLKAVATNKSDVMKEYPLELSVSGSSFSITFRGRDMIGFGDDGTITYKIPLGKYIISLWQNRGELYETAWDVQALQLVSHTFKENDDEDGLDVGHCDLGVIDFTNKFLLEVTSRLEAIDETKEEYEVLKQSLGEYKSLFDDVKASYESGAFNGKDLTWDDLTDEQKDELRVHWKGMYDASVEYASSDAVQGDSKVCLSRKDGNVGHSLDDAEWWQTIIDLSETKTSTDAAKEIYAELSAWGEEAKTAETARKSAELERKAEHAERMEQVEGAIVDTAEMNEHPTYVGEDFYVYTYDILTHSYTKTNVFVKGEGFNIDATFPSVAAMNASGATKDGCFYMVVSNTEDEDNGKLYVKSDGALKFIVDMSGVRGFTGKTPQIAIGTVTPANSLYTASASLTANGTDANGNPKFLLNLTVPRFSYANLTSSQIEELQKPATDAAEELKQRINSGEFKGEKGDKGDKGDRGEDFYDAPSDGNVYGRKDGQWERTILPTPIVRTEPVDIPIQWYGNANGAQPNGWFLLVEENPDTDLIVIVNGNEYRCEMKTTRNMASGIITKYWGDGGLLNEILNTDLVHFDEDNEFPFVVAVYFGALVFFSKVIFEGELDSIQFATESGGKIRPSDIDGVVPVHIRQVETINMRYTGNDFGLYQYMLDDIRELPTSIIFNGTKYSDLSVEEMDYEGMRLRYVGNADLIETGEYHEGDLPFAIADYPDFGVALLGSIVEVDSLEEFVDYYENKLGLDAVEGIGKLSDLITEEKGSIVAAINEAAQSGGSASGGSGMTDDDREKLATLDLKVGEIEYVLITNDEIDEIFGVSVRIEDGKLVANGEYNNGVYTMPLNVQNGVMII